MVEMVKACDEFGEFLGRVRKRAGVTVKTLGNAVGKSDDYIGGWIRNPRAVNRIVLNHVSDVLDLNIAERVELSRLADLRIQSKWHIPARSIEAQVQLNLAQALSEIDFEIPKNLSGSVGVMPGYTASWSLSRYAAMHMDAYAPDRCGWPERIATERIITPSNPEEKRHSIPRELIEEKMPQLQHLLRIERQQAFYLALDMAEVYSRFLFSDLERAREVAGALHHWSLVEAQGVEPAVTLTFRDVRHQAHNVPGITWNMASFADKRDLAGYLWESANTRSKLDELRRYPYRFQEADHIVLNTYRSARFYVAAGGKISASMDELEKTRAALYVARSNAWSSGGTFQLEMRYHLSREHAKEPHSIAELLMSNDDLAPSSKDDPRLQIIYTLEDALRRMEREAERGTLIDPFGKTTKSKPTAMARRTGKTSAKRKSATKARRKTRKKEAMSDTTKRPGRAKTKNTRRKKE